MPAQPPKRENLFINLGCNVALPSIILNWGSKAAWLGPKWALVIALVFPVGYSIYDFVEHDGSTALPGRQLDRQGG